MATVVPRRDRFESLLAECEAHEHRLNQAKANCRQMFPLDAGAYAALTDEQVTNIDQLVYRFSKLQDAVGAKLVPATVRALREDAATLTIIDSLNELEKAGALESAERWMQLRETRNQLAHDYQDDPEEGSENLNSVYRALDYLLSEAQRLCSFVRTRVLPGLE